MSYSIADPYDKCYDIVEQFMGRSLTKDYDVLPALSGLARVFQHVLNDTYCAGLWKKEIICSLLWNRSPRYPADRSTRFDLARLSDYLAPSWSWASILGKQSSMSNNWKTRDALRVSAHSVAKILNVHTVLKGADPFGQASGGELVLRTRFCKLEDVPPVYTKERQFHDETPESTTQSVFQRAIYTRMGAVDTIIYEIFQQHAPCPNQEFGVIEIVRWDKALGSDVPGIDFLVVKSTGRRDGEYRRIGQVGLRKYPIPIKGEVIEEQYLGTIEENDAYGEVIRAKWKKITVTIV